MSSAFRLTAASRLNTSVAASCSCFGRGHTNMREGAHHPEVEADAVGAAAACADKGGTSSESGGEGGRRG